MPKKTSRKAKQLAERAGAVYSRQDIAEHLGVGVSTLKAMENRGAFPRPDVILSQRCVRWTEKTFVNWLQSRQVKE